MLGGGIFEVQNKTLPGSYINFVSLNNGLNVFGERGVAVLAMELTYGSDSIMEITKDDLINNCNSLLGYSYDSAMLTDIREVLRNAKKLYLYKFNQTNQAKASCKYCTAKGYGSRGNSFKISVNTNIDNTSKKDVTLYFDNVKVYEQTVASMSELKSNNYVNWNYQATLETTVGLSLTGGIDGTVTGEDMTKFINSLDSISFNAVGIVGDNSGYEDILIAYTKRMREEVGKKFQCVTSDSGGYDEGCVLANANLANVENYHIVPWVTGAIAGCAVNKSLTNQKYNGEYIIRTDFTQSFYENCIKNGIFTFHNVGGEVRVLMDINCLTEFSENKGEVFKDNQTVRICDSIAMDIAEIFNNYYLGKVPNDKGGRNSLWGDIVKHHQKLLDMRAIDDFEEKDIAVEQGEKKSSVVIMDCITPANSMTKLYMTVTIN